MNYEKKYKEKLDAAKYWHDASEGDIPAVLEEIFPELKESEDEKIRKALIDIVNARCELYKGITKEMFLAWLEKQSEQKSTLKIDNSIAKVVFPFKAKVKSTGIVVTIYGGQLSGNGKEWIKYQSDKEDGYSVYEPEDLEPVCNVKLQYVWSEEDELMLKCVIGHFERQKRNCIEGGGRKNAMQEFIDWLKSLKDKYAWKPSIAQLNALSIVSKGNVTDDIEAIVSLYNDLKKLR